MNETKIEILKCLSDGDWRTTPDVAYECGIGLTNASELLRRYRSQSLVNRIRNYSVPRGYLYRITEAGQGRLGYLTTDELKSSTVIAQNIGFSGSKKRAFDQWVKNKLRG